MFRYNMSAISTSALFGFKHLVTFCCVFRHFNSLSRHFKLIVTVVVVHARIQKFFPEGVQLWQVLFDEGREDPIIPPLPTSARNIS